jgi:glutamyl endopeptidase
MLRRRWAAAALAAVALGAAAPPAGPAVAATNRDRVVSGDAASSGHRAVSVMVTPSGDIAAATAPTAGVTAIFGPDNRVPVSPTTTYPASATVLLTFTGGQCTGFMISERTVATAGHCLHTGGATGTWRTNVVAHPGHDGTTAPFGSCAAVQLFVPQNWTGAANAPGAADPAYDYGAVRLNCAIGTRTGWFALGYTTQRLTGSCTTTQGYPAGRPGQWTSNDVIRAETASALYVRHPLTSGQDGSPLFYTPDPDDWCPTIPPLVKPCPCPPPPPDCLCPHETVLGILSSGPYGSGPGSTNNIALRITQQITNNLMQWR